MFWNDCIFHFLSLEGNNLFQNSSLVSSQHSGTLSDFHRTGSCFMFIYIILQENIRRRLGKERWWFIKQKVAEKTSLTSNKSTYCKAYQYSRASYYRELYVLLFDERYIVTCAGEEEERRMIMFSILLCHCFLRWKIYK